MIGTMRSIFAPLATIALVLIALLPAPGASQARPLAAPNVAGLDPALRRAGTSSAVPRGIDLGRLPLYFVENRGQIDNRVAYYVLGGATQVYLTADGVTFGLIEPHTGGSLGSDGGGEAFLEKPTATARVTPGWGPGAADDLARNASPLRGHIGTPRQRWTVKLEFVGANPHARPVGENQTKAVVSYFKGESDEWHAGLPTYAQIVYHDLWPGIDLAYHGHAGQLKYDLVVHPGADPAQIRLGYRGAESVTLNAAGQLEVTTPLGGFSDEAPIAWQEIDGQRAPVDVAFDPGMKYAPRTTQYATLAPALSRDAGDHSGSRDLGGSGASAGVNYPLSAIGHSQSFGFSLGAYDRSQPLVIDPAVLVYCGYIGGSSDDSGSGIAVDGAGNAYVTGEAWFTQDSFPVTVGPDLTFNDGSDVFVAKVSASDAALVYAGYIGGSSYDWSGGIAVDDASNAYITGYTQSSEDTFPVTVGPDLTFNGAHDAFVAKVDASGTALVYAGYIGGSSYDRGNGIAVDDAGNAYVTGHTQSNQETFPVTAGPDLTFHGAWDAFVAKVSTSGEALMYAGYIGGLSDDYGSGIAVDSASNAYVTGTTHSTEDSFPATGEPDLTYNGAWDAFVAKVSTSGEMLMYAGYIGGLSDDRGYGIAVDDAGNAYVTGYTQSANDTFPATGGPDLTFNGGSDAFVAKVSASDAALVYAGYVGGATDDYGRGIAVDRDGNAYVTGYTRSPEDTFPVIGGPDLTFNGGSDVLVAKVSASGAALIYAGYIGGSSYDSGAGIAVDGAGNAYVTGYTSSSQDSFPVASGPDLTHNGDYDAFVAKVSASDEETPTPTMTSTATESPPGTSTATPTATHTSIPAWTPTATGTHTPTAIYTSTPTSTATATSPHTPTATLTRTGASATQLHLPLVLQ